MNNGIPVVTLRDLNYPARGLAEFGDLARPAIAIPAGTKLNVAFSEKSNSKVVFNHNGNWHALLVTGLHNTLKATNGVKFGKCPSLNKLEKMSNDGVCTTVTGCRVEPDGTGPDGSSSWLLVMGVI